MQNTQRRIFIEPTCSAITLNSHRHDAMTCRQSNVTLTNEDGRLSVTSHNATSHDQLSFIGLFNILIAIAFDETSILVAVHFLIKNNNI